LQGKIIEEKKPVPRALKITPVNITKTKRIEILKPLTTISKEVKIPRIELLMRTEEEHIEKMLQEDQFMMTNKIAMVAALMLMGLITLVSLAMLC